MTRRPGGTHELSRMRCGFDWRANGVADVSAAIVICLTLLKSAEGGETRLFRTSARVFTRNQGFSDGTGLE